MVEYLEIFNQTYPIRIGYYVMKKVKEETGKTFSKALQEADEEGDIEVHEIILYHALEMGHYAEHGNMDIDVSEEEIPMMLDVCFTEYLKLFGSETFFPKDLQEMAENQRLENGKQGQKRTKSPQKQT